MNSPKKLNLIDGTFSPKETREILNSVFTTKINFHQMKNFSSQERFGKEDKKATKRIPELKKSLERACKIVEEAEKRGELLVIKSEIVLHSSK